MRVALLLVFSVALLAHVSAHDPQPATRRPRLIVDGTKRGALFRATTKLLDGNVLDILLLNGRGLPGQDEGSILRRLAEVSYKERRLLQTEDDDDRELSCFLTSSQQDRYLDSSTRTWVIDDDVLDVLDDDLQAIIDCTEEGDVILLDTSETITPASRITIPWQLTISGIVDDIELDDGVFPSAERATITCPDEDEGVFLIAAKSVLLANIFFDGCEFATSSQLAGIVEVEECESEDVDGIVQLHHVGFTDNRLIGGLGLLMNGPSCSATELIDVEFRDNEFNGFCGAVLSSRNTLDDVVIDENKHVRDADDIPAILYAPEGSTTTAKDVDAQQNLGTVIFIDEGNLTLTDSSFSDNSADVSTSQDRFGSCLHLVNALVEIDDCEFSDNEADLGGVMHMERSAVVISDCTFEDNSADDGAVFYAKERSRIEIDESIFSDNSADDDGGVVHGDDSSVIVRDSSFDKNSAEANGGCFWFLDKGTLVLTRSNFTGNEAAFGGVISFENEAKATMEECIFDTNKAKTLGGTVYMEASELTVDSSHVMGGNATNGGAIYMTKKSELTIRSTVFEKNKASKGGCIYATGTSVVDVVNSSFFSNSAKTSGGVLSAKKKSALNIKQSNFSSNSANGQAGAVETDASTLIISESIFVNNSGPNGGAIAANNATKITVEGVRFEKNRGRWGGAVVVHDFGEGSIANCSFSENRAERSGGSLYLELSKIDVEDSRFLDGESIVGGFVFSSECTLTILRSSFANGTAKNSGGCVDIANGKTTILQDSSLSACSAETNGGAIDTSNTTAVAVRNCTILSSSAKFGGGMRSMSCKLVVQDSVFENGRATNGGGINSFEASTLAVFNCRFSRNIAEYGGAVFLLNDLPAEISNCSFEENDAQNSGGAVYVDNATASMTKCELMKNSASFGGSVFVISQAELKINSSSCIDSSAENGGCMECKKRSSIEADTMTIHDSRALKHGGAVAGNDGCDVSFANSTLSSNGAQQDGGAFYFVMSDFKGANLTIRGNDGGRNGGGLYCEEGSSLDLSNSDFVGNSAQRGGGVVTYKVARNSFRNLSFADNTATYSGGAAYVQESEAIFDAVHWSGNKGRTGGSLYVIDAPVNITNSEWTDSRSIGDGGAVYASENSSLRLENVSIANARAGGHGGAASLQSSHVVAINVTATSCRSGKDGGILLANATSTLLCIDCILKKSAADGKGGAVSVDSNQTQQLAVQFQRSVLSKNKAEFGGLPSGTCLLSHSYSMHIGGLHFAGPYVNADCSKKKANCTFLALSDTRFEGNEASYAGGAIFTTDLKTIRIRCSKERSADANATFFSREEWESMDVIRSPDDLCSNWKDNSAKEYGSDLGTYASFVKTEIQYNDGPVDISTGSELHVIKKHPSGERLPNITLRIVDELENGPAIGVNDNDVTAILSADGFISGSVSLLLTNGNGTFDSIVGFQVPDTYNITVGFSEESLKEVQFQVEIRNCTVGETEASGGRFCEDCSAATYSFDPNGKEACRPCPDNSNCTSVVIRPNKGYWNQFPCSEHIQRCLTKRACEYKERDEALEGIGARSKNCSYVDEDIIQYHNDSCRKGHKGPLCGSCEENYGKSQSFNCEACFTGLGNVVLVLLSIMMLMGLAGFATRSNLISFTKIVKESNPANGKPGPSSGAPPEEEHGDLEMMEKYYLGRGSEGSHQPFPQRINVRERAARQAELAKWKAVELFKITAIAISINVDWSLLLVGLFETAEFAGGITSEATNRSVDCLISEESSVPRSIVSTIIDLFVPGTVVCLFVFFWTVVTWSKKESFAYFLKRSILSALAVFYISYISITKTVVNILSCVKVHDSMVVMIDHVSAYWAIDTSLKCYEGSHGVLAGVVGWPLLFAFSLLFPIVVAITIVRNVKQDYEEGWIYDIAGFMYRSYGRKFVFWESIIMLRKAVLAVVVVFAYPLESSMQAVLAVFVLAVSLYLQMICRPYRKEFETLNEMEGISLLVSLLTFVSSLCFDDHVPFGARVAITIVVFLCNTGLFLFFASLFFVFSSKHLKSVLDREEVKYNAEGGTIHILRVYFFVHISGKILGGLSRCLKCLIGPRFSDRN